MNNPNQPPRGGPGQCPQQQNGARSGAQPPWQPRAPIRPKKRRSWPWIVLGVAAFILVASVFSNTPSTTPIAGPGSAPTTTAPRTPASGEGAATVTYEIIGRSKASHITYTSDGAGNLAQEANVRLPWRKEITVEHGVAIPTLSVQNGGSGEITCRIRVDGNVVREATSSGQFVVVSCVGAPIT